MQKNMEKKSSTRDETPTGWKSVRRRAFPFDYKSWVQSVDQQRLPDNWQPAVCCVNAFILSHMSLHRVIGAGPANWVLVERGETM